MSLFYIHTYVCIFIYIFLRWQGEQTISPKGNQSWLFIGRTDTEAEAPILRPPDLKSWLSGKDPNVGKGWGHEKGATEDEMVGWHHRLDGHEFEQTPGDGDGQGGLASCSPCVRGELDTTERLNNNIHIFSYHFPCCYKVLNIVLVVYGGSLLIIYFIYHIAYMLIANS